MRGGDERALGHIHGRVAGIEFCLTDFAVLDEDYEVPGPAG